MIRCSKIDNSLVNSKPCEQCVDLMREVGIKTVYYSSEHSTIIKENVYKMKTYVTFGNRYINYVLHPERCTDIAILENEKRKRLNKIK